MITELRGGTVVDPVDGMRAGDVVIDDDRIVAVRPGRSETVDGAGSSLDRGVDRMIDANGLLIMPGGIDSHSHADARVLDDDVQLALLRSGVTSVIVGQDGVSFAPGDGTYATDYFGPLNGRHPTYRGGGVGELLASWDRGTRLNVGYLVPAGTVRYEILGQQMRQPSDGELTAMTNLVREGLAEGALGLSSGLDYVPGAFADAAELAALCRPVAEAGGCYVSHMRGYEEDAPTGFAELLSICEESGVRGHVSHFHARPELVAELLERADRTGVDVSWDAYPYLRGFTLLSMLLLPKELIRLGNVDAAERLRDPATVDRLTARITHTMQAEGQDASWAERIQIAGAGDPATADLEGCSLAEAGRRRGVDPVQLALGLLADSQLTVTAVVRIDQPRTDDHLAQQFRLRGACSGSDGIFLGGAPHPRGYGCSARMLSRFGRIRQDFDWPQLAAITSGNAARRFGLSDRGRIVPGAVADLALVDPQRIADRADYDQPTELSVGIDHVFVSGQQVLTDGRLNDELVGRALRR